MKEIQILITDLSDEDEHPHKRKRIVQQVTDEEFSMDLDEMIERIIKPQFGMIMRQMKEV